MGKFSAREFELQAPVVLRGKMIFAIYFLGSEYFAQRLDRPFDKIGQTNFHLSCHIIGQILGL